MGPKRRRPTSDSRLPKRLRLGLKFALALAVIAGVFVYLIPKIASYSAVWRVVSGLSARGLALLLAATAFNIFTYWPQMVASLPGLTLFQAAVNNQASTAIANTLPGGGALGVAVAYKMFRDWGFDNAAIGLMVLVTGVWNSLVKFGMPLVALGILAIEGDVTRGLAIAGLIGLVALLVSLTLLVLILWDESFARAIGKAASRAASVALRVIGRDGVGGWDVAAAAFRKRTIDLVRRRWHWLTLATLMSHVGLYAVLLIALREVGVSAQQVSWAEALGVFAFARLTSALPITPGGAGVIELTYIGGLVLAGGGRAQVVAAVLVFRALTWGLQIPLGPIAYVIYQRRVSWRRGSVTGPRRHTRSQRARRTPAKAAV